MFRILSRCLATRATSNKSYCFKLNLDSRRYYSGKMRYLNQVEAIEVDKSLFNEYKFSVDQLMELAGQSCAIAIANCYPIASLGSGPLLICCGPGNNGGDGLVCARHLKQFGYNVEVYYPRITNSQLYENLNHQCIESGIPVLSTMEELKPKYNLIVDALFGFSFKPPVRKNFLPIMSYLKDAEVPICSIDIPSGWHVEDGPPQEYAIHPEMLISLTCPKLCAKFFKGKHHFLGGRFVPDKLKEKYNLGLPQYPGTEYVVKIE